MSGLNLIRRITDNDIERMEAAAKRFAKRHGIELTEPGWAKYTIDGTTYEYLYNPSAAEEVAHYVSDRPRLARLWQAAFCRALGFRPCADLTLGWGYVATRCK